MFTRTYGLLPSKTVYELVLHMILPWLKFKEKYLWGFSGRSPEFHVKQSSSMQSVTPGGCTRQAGSPGIRNTEGFDEVAKLSRSDLIALRAAEFPWS